MHVSNFEHHLSLAEVYPLNYIVFPSLVAGPELY
jgi:hypothetical protein